MKTLTLLFLLTLALYGRSQGVFQNQAHSTLQQVIGDYPNHFSNILGPVLTEDPQSTDFASKVALPGAVQTYITRYHPESRKLYSWKCVAMETDEYETASKKYNELFRQIRNSIIKIEGHSPYILNGTLEEPDESRKFTNSSFFLVPSAPGRFRRLKVELSMEFYVIEWKVSLLVYEDPGDGMAAD